MDIVLLLIIAGIAASVAATVSMARKYRWRWGHRRIVEEPTSSDGPFRLEPAAETYELLGVPLSKKLLGILSIIWALMTGLFFVPAGVVFLLISGEFAEGSLAVLGIIGVVAVVFSGFLLAFSLGAASKAVMSRDVEKMRRTAKWSLIHHLGVIASFAMFDEMGLFLFALVPCLWGLIHAYWLHQTAKSVAEIDDLARTSQSNQSLAVTPR